jgi:ribonucleoside-diphosphate reductase alpha chain
MEWFLMSQFGTDAVMLSPDAATDSAPRIDVQPTENALRVLQARYLKKDESGTCTELPADLFRRVARTMAAVETTHYGATETQRREWEDKFYDIMVEGRYMPNSPTLMNAGREMGMLSACFVLPVGDSINEIFDSIKYTAIIQKAGGGTGFAFDELRPTGDYIKSSGGTTSGPISFWRAFSEATNAIQQGAFRRGANMGMMNIHHPDILKFLHAKEDLTQFTNYNISVKVSDAWMDEFLADENSLHVVRNPRNGQEYLMPKDLDIWGYDVRTLVPFDSSSGVVPEGDFYTKQDIWGPIVQNAWRTGEPGVVFIDRVNDHNPTPHVGRMEATNPCGEQPLLPFEACNLGSINLGTFVTDACTPSADVDWDALRESIHVSTRFLDNVIDANNYQLPQIDAICKANRKIGLGIMGFADALFKLNTRYNSDDGIAWGERFMKFVNDEAHNYSEKLAHERGCFPNWKGSIWETEHKRPMRNACTTTVAPTGTISIIAGCSGGIEPLFSLAFFRNVLKGQEQGKGQMVETNEIFERVAKARGFHSEGLMDQIATDGTLAHLDGVPDDVRDVFVCAHDIEPEWHVKMQAAFQRHCDSSISKTINFPHDAKPQDVQTIYKMAYELDCKGVTVYRDGCRASQPMALKDSDKKKEEQKEEAVAKETKSIFVEPSDLPEIVSGLRIRQMTPFGNMHVKITVNPVSELELEVFAQLGKGGDVANSDLEAICRMISLWLRAGGRLRHVIQQLKGIGSSLQVATRDGRITSLGDGLARALIKYQRAKEQFGLKSLLLGEYDINELDRVPSVAPGNGSGNGAGTANGKRNGKSLSERHAETAQASLAAGTRDASSSRMGFIVKCPECQNALSFAEGCVKCHSCGFSQC